MSTQRLPSPRPTTWLRRAVLAAAIAGGSLFLAPASASAQQPAVKIAVIELRRAVGETEAGLRVQANLKKLFDARQVELDAKQRQIQTDKEALEKEMQAGKSSKELLQKKYEKLLQQDADFQKLQMEYQREMQRKEAELTGPIVAGIQEAVRRIAAQDGFELVLEKGVVHYVRADLDITDRAIQLYNSGAAKAGPAPKAPAAPVAPAAPPAKAPAPPAKK
jgi:outer membrane protein